MTGSTLSQAAYRRGLFAITLLAWGLRVYLIRRFIGFSAALDPADGLDEIDYEQLAHQMSLGNGYVLDDGTATARRAPGTPLVILPIYVCFGRALVAARVWMSLLSALTCVAAAWVVEHRCGRVAALLTAAAVAVNPGLFYYAVHLWSEAPYCLATTLAVGCLLRASERNSGRWSILAGLCWGMAVLIRPQLVLLAPCVAAAVLWVKPADRGRWFRELGREALVVLALIAPWLVRNQLVIGTPALTTLVGGHTFWGAHNGATFREDRYRGLWKTYLEDPGVTFPLTGTEPEQDRQAWANGWHCIALYRDGLPRLMAAKIYRLLTPFEETPNRLVYWSFAATWIVSVPFIGLGMVRLRRRDPELWAWIVLNLAAVFVCTLLFYGAARFRHAVEPFLMMAAAVGLEQVLQRAGVLPADSSASGAERPL